MNALWSAVTPHGWRSASSFLCHLIASQTIRGSEQKHSVRAVKNLPLPFIAILSVSNGRL